MPKSHAFQLPDDLDLDPRLRAAWNLYIVAVEERFDAVETGIRATRASIDTVDRRLSDMAKIFIENCDSNQRLMNTLEAERRMPSAPPRVAVGYGDLPPMRGRADTMNALEELRAAATSHKSIPSDRVEQLIEVVIDRRRLKTLDDETKARQRAKMTILTSVISAAIVALLTFMLGHFEGRSSAPVQYTPTPAGR